MRLLIVGAGGHGEVVADILHAQRAAGADLDLIGYVDDDRTLREHERLGGRVIGSVREIPALTFDALIVAVGENAARARLIGRLNTMPLATAVHPSAVIAGGSTIGKGSMICARAVVGCGSHVGRGVILNTASTIDHHAQIGDFVHIAPGVHLGGAVTIGAAALLGIGAVVLPGVTIGANAVVGAGAVVIRDVPDGAKVVGVPAVPLSAAAGVR
jgi:sugar O-acyltransferase (sialic acid O-acetyltransferase NeuD family)